MKRMVFYELKKILSLPTLILLAAAGCILAGMSGSRYAEFPMLHGVSAAQYRTLTLSYAGPLDEALAGRALADYRALPDENDYMNATNSDNARRRVLETLAEEYAAVSGGTESSASAASWDANRRMEALLAGWRAPAAVHGYYAGWTAYREALSAEAPYLLALLIVFGLAPLFAGETAAGMAALCRTFRYGRWGQTLAKLLAAGIFSLACGLLCALLPLGCCALCFGLDGGSLPAAYLSLNDSGVSLAYPFTIAAYAGLRIALLALGALGLGAVMALLSSLMPSTAAAAAGGVVFLAPVLYSLSGLSLPALDTLMRYMPSSLFSPDALLGVLPVMLFDGGVLLASQWLGLLWGLLGAALALLSGRLYLRRLREEPTLEE